MCGIAGVIAPPRGSASVEVCQGLVRANTMRGNSGYGLFFANSKSEILIRGLGGVPGRVVEDAYDTLWRATSELPSLFLAHVRAPTGGGEQVGLTRTHPFELDNLLFAHNGLILNWRARFEKWLASAPLSFWGLNVDSAALLAGIVKTHEDSSCGWTEAIGSVMDEINGAAQASCWLYDRVLKKTHLWRLQSTLFAGVDARGALSFSSNKVEGLAGLAVPQGHILSATPGDIRWERSFRLENVPYDLGGEMSPSVFTHELSAANSLSA